ncbi:MAG: phosphodiester glycosidase family protein [Gluconacetobacter diazotrophicus]|nr:phosphodiester glycosidase family protein [Gluconacetobacter diazotrophicus]
MRFLAFCLLSFAPCLLPLRAAAQTGWKVTSSEALPAPAEGVAHHLLTLERPHEGGTNADNDPANEATLHFVSFEAGAYTFRLFDQNPHDNASLADTMAENHCVAGTNGGYFSPEFDPVGLLVCDGRTVRPEGRSRLLSGVLAVTAAHHISLRRVNESAASSLPGKHARQAVQCGPFLVEDRRPVAGLNAARAARRTAVFTDGGGRWGLAVCTPVTLEEFAAILADPALTPGGLKIARALNLDGGGSTALWVRPAPGGKSGEPVSLPERGYVRDFVGIVPRPRVAVAKP